MIANHATYFKLVLVVTVTLIVKNTFANSSLTISGGGDSINPMAQLHRAGRNGVAQGSTSKDLNIRIRGSCYATNLRGVANPVSPNSILKMSGKIAINGGAATAFSVQIPSRVVVGGGLVGSGIQNLSMATATGLPLDTQLAASGNMVVLKLINKDTAMQDPVTGKISDAKNIFNVTHIRFDQVTTGIPAVPTDEEYYKYIDFARARGNYIYPKADYLYQIATREYTAKNGPMSGTVTVGKSSNGKTVDVIASFPGEALFCGGYYSPLMVFFDQAKPQFNNITAFDMGTGRKTHWPEANHSGYFIALPKNGKINSHDQLFGEGVKFKNGFLKLAQYDTNKDGVIDARDPVFKKLILWKDKKGLGVFSAKDSLRLNQKITTIHLNYNSQVEPAGAFAEFRQKSYFEFTDDKLNSLQRGEVIDVWLKPAR